MTIKDLKKGDFFRLSSSESAPVWVKGDYDRSDKTFSCYRFDDVNHETFLKATRQVFTEFEF